LKSTDGGTETGAKSATCTSLLTATSLKSGDRSSMSLLKIKEFDPNYRETFQGKDIKGMSLYANPEEKIGTISDILVDEQGHFRYFVVDLGLWIFGKKVLLPIGRSRIDHSAERIYTVGMTKQQAENLPEFNEHREIDYNYEEQVRGVYRSEAFLEKSAPLDTASARGVGLNTPSSRGAASAVATPPEKPILHNGNGNGNAYDYKQEPALYELNEQDHQTFKLYQERLIANKIRAKTGEVTIGKHTETETAKV
jgi:stress response protein YsnF